MMYRILLDGTDIYGANSEMSVISPNLDIELNSAGSLEFTLPVDNVSWATPNVFTNEVEVIEDGEVIFFGRPLQITRDWNNQKRVVCEGALAYFNDTIQRTHEIKISQHVTLEQFFRYLIGVHNSQVDDQEGSGISHKHFEVGVVSVENKGKYVYRMTDYQTTYECLQQMCLDTDGGYFILRKEYDEYGNAIRYIDWVNDMPYGSDQPVQFGVNLLDLSQDLNGADICTVLIPIGGENINLSGYQTISPSNPEYKGVGHISSSDEIYYKPAMDLYGRVVQQKSWPDYTDQSALWRKAAEWLKRKNEYIPTIEVSAADLHYIDKYKDHGTPMYSAFKLGMAVQVISAPHGLTETIPGEEEEDRPTLIIHKLSLDLDSATKKITIGTPPKKELTDILAPSAGGSSTRGSGGNGDGEGSTTIIEEKIVPIRSIGIKYPGQTEYTNAVSNKKAYIDLSEMSGNVEDVTVDGVSVVDPETKVASVNVPVKGVTVDGVDVVNPETGIAEINSSASIGKIQDISWHERSPFDEETSTTRTTSITSDGIYVSFMYYSDASILSLDGSKMIGEFSLTTNASNIIREEYINHQVNNPTYGEVAMGKMIIFEGHAGDSVNFYTRNNRYTYLSSSDTPTNPHANNCYEIDKTNHVMILTPDTTRNLSKKYYALNNVGDTSQHYEHIHGTIEYVFKIRDVDERYLAFIDEYWPSGAAFDLKTVIPNTNDTYLVCGLVTGNTVTQPGNYIEEDDISYYEPIPISGDPDSFLSLISSDKRIIHIGDGEFDSSKNHQYTYLNNSHNVQYMSGSSTHYVTDGMSYLAIATGKEFNSKSALILNSYSTGGGSIYAFVIRLSKPDGVLDVQVDNQSIVDEDGIANLNSSDFGTTVVANPVESATDDLTKVQIGNTVYDIPGGSGGGSVYLNTIYDETERQVGYYYGKPLYQKTWDINVSAPSDNTWYSTGILLADYDVDTIVDGEIVDIYNQSIPSVVGKVNDTHFGVNTYVPNRTLTKLTARYTKTTDKVDPNPQIGNLIYLPTIYSEEERQVGVWTDGKPLWKKTWDLGSDVSLSQNTWIDTSIPNSNLSIITYSECLTSSGIHRGQVEADVNSTGSYVQLRSDGVNATVRYVTLQYTKTTDTPGSGTWTPDGNLSHRYSTTEHIIGTWIDGSTLWEKTIIVGTPTYKAYTSYSHSISNLGKLVNAFGSCTNNGSSQLNVPLPNITSQYSIFLGNVDSTDFYYQFGSGFDNVSDFTVTLQYTKS